MVIEKWRVPLICGQIKEAAIAEGNSIMDDVVTHAKARCPSSPIVREGKWSGQQVISFTIGGGRKAGKYVEFVAKRWLGREPGDLRNTIRRVNKRDRPGNIRVYAGNTKIYWAYMVELGTLKTRAQPFLRPAFNQIKSTYQSRMEKGIRKRVPEVTMA